MQIVGNVTDFNSIVIILVEILRDTGGDWWDSGNSSGTVEDRRNMTDKGSSGDGVVGHKNPRNHNRRRMFYPWR
jgi:hypothetical protein